MNLEADGKHEILVRDWAIPISVKVFEDQIALFFRHRESPHIQKVHQLLLLNVLITVFIESLERFADSLPLRLDFLDELLEDVSLSHQVVSCSSIVCPFPSILLLYMLFKLWVAFWIMTEDECGQVVNLVSYPQTEVCVVQLARPVFARAHIFHNFCQVVEIDLDVGTVDSYDILWFYPAIMVLIKGQERFVDWSEVAWYLEAYQTVQFLDSLLNLLDVLLLFNISLWWVCCSTVHNWIITW